MTASAYLAVNKHLGLDVLGPPCDRFLPCSCGRQTHLCKAALRVPCSWRTQRVTPTDSPPMWHGLFTKLVRIEDPE